MRRLLCVWLPHWPIERMARASPGCIPDDRPFALALATSRGLVITACNALAHTNGVRTGLTLADARAALPALETRPAELECDHAVLLKLARACCRYGPLYNVDGDDGIWIDITGVAHLYKGEAGLACDLLERLARGGISVRIGLADTLGAAHALSRFGTWSHTPIRISITGTTAAALAPLPIESLRLDADTSQLLRRLGLARVGDVVPLPRAALEHRFHAGASQHRRGGAPRSKGGKGLGKQAAAWTAHTVLKSLDRALGREPEPRPPLSTPAPHIARLRFAEPLLHAEAVVGVLETLIEAVSASLAGRLEGARRFRLVIFRVDGSYAQALIGTSAACREASHLRRLFADRIANLDAGFGVDAMALEALDVEELTAVALTLGGDLHATPRGDAGMLIDRLANRLGDACVRSFAAFDSHVPERASRQVSARKQGLRRALAEPGAGSQGQDPPDAARHNISPTRKKPPRPAFLLARPEPIKVLALVPDGAPIRFSWRRVTHTIVKSQGPERIAPEWWRVPQAQAQPTLPSQSGWQPGGQPSAFPLERTRDYYQIEDQSGGRYWVFRNGLYGAQDAISGGALMGNEPAWFVHGLFG